MADSPSPRDPLTALLHGRATLLTRRSVLRSAAALGALGVAGGLGLTACGSDDEEASGGDTTASSDLTTTYSLLTLLNTTASLEAGVEGRMPFGIGDDRGAPIPDPPASLVFQISTAEGEPVVDDLEVAAHSEGLPLAYFPVRFTPPEPISYTIRTTIDGEELESTFTTAPGPLTIPRVGQPFPSATTPTADAPDGVDPICTDEPECGLHEVDLAAVLGTAPLAVLVSTPAFCQQAICGPVLDVLLDARDAAPEVTFIHVEVYASAEAVEAQGLEAPLTPAVEAWGLPYEPCLFLIGADGTLVERLDVVYDAAELADGLALLTG